MIPTVKDMARWLFDRLLPRRCLSCTRVVADEGAPVCPQCWGGLSFIVAPHCARCGVPFEQKLPWGDGEAILCGACMAHPPPFERARAIWRYDEASRRLILPFKHADATDAAPILADWLIRTAPELVAGADLIVPVPLHRGRLFRRRYNQAALLAWAVGRRCARPVCPDALLRTRPTVPQGGLGRLARLRNVRGAFRLHPGRQEQVRGRRILLIDDVHTTGATLHECSRVLMRAGAGAVDVLTLARAVREEGG